MNVMRSLGRTPERQFIVRVEVPDSGVLLHRQVRIAFVEEVVLANQVSFSEALFNIAEFERNFLVNIALFAIFVDAW